MKLRLKYCLGGLAIAILVIGAIGVGVYRQPIRALLSGQEPESFLEKAERAVAAGDWAAAERAARKAFEQERSVASLRILVTAMREQGRPNVLEIATILFQHPDATPVDRGEVLSLAMNSGDLVRAGAMLQALPEEELEDVDVRYEAVRFSLAAGKFRQAVEIAEEDVVGDRWPEFELLIAKGMAESGNDGSRTEVLRRIVRVLAHPNRQIALEAMRLLATVPSSWIPRNLASEVVERFGLDSDLPPEDRLNLAYFQFGLESLAQGTFVDSIVDKFRDDHMGPLCKWLLRVGEAKRLVELTDSEDHPDGLSREVYELRLKALASLGSFERVEAELDSAPEEFPDLDLLAYRAVILERRDKKTEAEEQWQKAMEEAESDPNQNHFYRLSAIAENAGNQDWQMAALAKAVEHQFGYPPPARYLRPLFVWLYQQSDTERLLAISFRLLQREPDNPGLINNYYYLRALYDQPDRQGAEILKKMVEQQPERSTYRDTLAFVQVKLGEPEAALATLDELGSELSQLSQNGRAAYAAALAALGRADEAEALAAKIDWSVFATKEAEVLRALCAKGPTVGAETGEP